jgi:hypothetical protein
MVFPREKRKTMTDEQFIEKLYAETRALTAGVDTRKGESVDTSQLREGDLILNYHTVE